MAAIRVVDRIRDQADFNSTLIDGGAIKYDETTDQFVLTPLTYIHNQLVSSDTWTVTHTLNKYPSVSVVDSAGTLVFGDVHYIDNANLVITFSLMFGGQAFLN